LDKLRPDIPCELTAALPQRRFLLLSLIVKDDSRAMRESAEGGHRFATMPSDPATAWFLKRETDWG
jgi:hypothetical protein